MLYLITFLRKSTQFGSGFNDIIGHLAGGRSVLNGGVTLLYNRFRILKKISNKAIHIDKTIMDLN